MTLFVLVAFHLTFYANLGSTLFQYTIKLQENKKKNNKNEKSVAQRWSHPIIYLIIWEMHGFSHQFPIVRENATKPIVWRKPGKLVIILFP